MKFTTDENKEIRRLAAEYNIGVKALENSLKILIENGMVLSLNGKFIITEKLIDLASTSYLIDKEGEKNGTTQQ